MKQSILKLENSSKYVNRTQKSIASMIIALLAALGFIYMVYQVGYQIAKNEQQPVIVYQVDNAGAELVGKITAKEVIEGKYTVEAGPYGKFLVSKEIYDSIEVGDDIPEILKGVSYE